MNEPQYNPKLTGIQNFKIAFEKGKLEHNKEIIKLLDDIKTECWGRDYDFNLSYIKERIKQLQKEISVPEKQVQIGGGKTR